MKMYKISVPVINNRVDRESGGRELVLSELGRIGAERVFLSLGTHIVNKEKRKKEFDILKENCKFFKSHNLEAGAWIWSFLPRTAKRALPAFAERTGRRPMPTAGGRKLYPLYAGVC